MHFRAPPPVLRLSKRARTLALTLAGLAVATVAQAALLANAGELSSTALVAGFDSFAAPSSNGRTAVLDLPGVALGVQAVNGPLRAGPAAVPASWALGSNGQWTPVRSYVGVDAGADTDASIYAGLVFDFGGLAVRQVGATLNFNPDFTYGAGFALPLYLAAYDRSGQLLDSHEVLFSTPGATNEGRFYGIAAAGADIARFEVSGPYAVVDNLSFTTPVPEAQAWLLAAAGLVVLRTAAGLRRAERGRRPAG